ncbi:MAG: GDP-mannose 4,6 dehydratase [Actinobacteria bacterium]|nr:GDP-mannose 4,6 dehydratase [Actinomycetota bacterium]|tara:strand:- start:7631 stop:8539 length:909 start_codon:yes stop_codon:yes gene_type:complete
MLALITGGSGFVGKHLADHLSDCGDDVLTTDISDGGPDLLDQTGINELILSAQPQVVYHLAAQADVGSSWESPTTTFRINAEGTLNVLSACRGAGVERVLTISSAEVYGKVPHERLPIVESLPLAPASPYAVSKVAAEMISTYEASRGLEVMCARSFNHFGPGQNINFVTSALAHRILQAKKDGRKNIPVGRLDTRRDFTDVRDVVRSYRSIISKGVSGESYNVCSGEDRSIGELAKALMTASGYMIDLVPDASLQRPSDIPVLRGDNTKIKSHTGWEPIVEFEETIKDIIETTQSLIDLNS